MSPRPGLYDWEAAHEPGPPLDATPGTMAHRRGVERENWREESGGTKEAGDGENEREEKRAGDNR